MKTSKKKNKFIPSKSALSNKKKISQGILQNVCDLFKTYGGKNFSLVKNYKQIGIAHMTKFYGYANNTNVPFTFEIHCLFSFFLTEI